MGFSPCVSPRSTPRPALPCSVPRRLASLGAVSLACQPGVTNRSICRRLEGAGERGQGYPCLPPSPTLLPTHIPFCLWPNSWQVATLSDSSSYQTCPPDPCYFKPQVLRPPQYCYSRGAPPSPVDPPAQLRLCKCPFAECLQLSL